MGYDNALDQVRDSQQAPSTVVIIAQVADITSNYISLKFPGETIASQKHYPLISGYTPAVGDMVACIPQGDTYIIVGKIVKEITRGTEYATKEAVEAVEANVNGLLDGSKIVSKAHTITDSSGSPIASGESTGLEPYGSTMNLGSQANKWNGVFANAWQQGSYSLIFSTESGGARVRPSNTNISLGNSQYKYKEIHATTIYQNGSAVSTSDKRKKKNVKDLNSKFIKMFNKLRPVTFKYKNGTSGRVHVGFIAQEVEQAMSDSGLTSQDFGGLVVNQGEYGLRYEEFIAIQTAVIQDLQKRVAELERSISDGK